MPIKDIFNSIDKGASKVTGKISDFFSPKPDIYKQPPVVNNKYSLKDRGIDISDDDIKALRPLIYGEVSNRDTSKKQLETDVILNTAINRAKEYSSRYNRPVSVSEVISMPNQYQAYGGPQYKLYNNPQNILDIQKKKEVDAIIDSIKERIASGDYPDTTEGSYYYIHNPDQTITYDNKKKLFK